MILLCCIQSYPLQTKKKTDVQVLKWGLLLGYPPGGTKDLFLFLEHGCKIFWVPPLGWFKCRFFCTGVPGSSWLTGSWESALWHQVLLLAKSKTMLGVWSNFAWFLLKSKWLWLCFLIEQTVSSFLALSKLVTEKIMSTGSLGLTVLQVQLLCVSFYLPEFIWEMKEEDDH